VDLLFFHIEYTGYVVIELKTGKFRPVYAGKLPPDGSQTGQDKLADSECVCCLAICRAQRA